MATGSISDQSVAPREPAHVVDAIRRGLGGDVRRQIQAGMPHRFRRPVFILAPPRSGSTMLFDALAGFPQFTTFRHHEGEFAWLRAQPYDRRRSRSDQMSPDDLGAWGRRYVRAQLYATACASDHRSTPWKRTVGVRPIRYLDKTISNCFRFDLLREMFPDAQFIGLVRDPRSNIGSMIDGWPHLERFGKPGLQDMLERAGGSLPHWTYPAPAGWEKTVRWSMPEVAAWSWARHAEAVADAWANGADRMTLVRYEQLHADPVGTVRGLTRFLGVPFGDADADRVVDRPVSRTAVTAPDRDKWRRHESEIEQARPLWSAVAQRCGYDV